MSDCNVLGVNFSSRTLKETIDYLKPILKENRNTPFHVITANPEIVMQMNRYDALKTVKKKAGLITADGIGVVMGAKILSKYIPERVTGVELLVELFRVCENSGRSVFLLGADEQTNQAFYKYVKETFPRLEIKGNRNGYFDVKDDDEVVDMINQVRPDVLITAMGSPRSLFWFDSRRNVLDTKMVMDVGGGFDTLTGRNKRAPKWVQRVHLEWLYRRFKNPERAKRQKDLYRFVGEIFKEKFRKVKMYG